MVKLKEIKVFAGVRYWQDCKYSTDNGATWIEPDDTDEDGDVVNKLLPGVEYLDDKNLHMIGWYWCINIDYETGKISSWKQGFCIETNFKVCDDGKYQILDDKKETIWDSDLKKYYYVPYFLSLDGEGFGDYIKITIDGNGIIKDWDLAKERITNLLEEA